MKIAEGDFLAFADHDDLLTKDALFECVKKINQIPDTDFLYSDEDKVSANGQLYFQPSFKPDFNIDLLRTVNYICHLVVVSRDLQKKVGVVPQEYDGAQDYDFILRCVEQARISHIYRKSFTTGDPMKIRLPKSRKAKNTRLRPDRGR